MVSKLYIYEGSAKLHFFSAQLPHSDRRNSPVQMFSEATLLWSFNPRNKKRQSFGYQRAENSHFLIGGSFSGRSGSRKIISKLT